MTDELDREERRELRRKARMATLEALNGLGGRGTRAEVLESAEAIGGFTERERTAPAPEAARGKYARRLDYELSWTLTNLRRDGLVTNPRWSVWALAGAAAEPDEQLAAPVAGDRLAELRAMPYRRYLRTPEWRETRAAALVRANHCCALDVRHTDRLEVHHRTYDRVGEERPSDLVVLCSECHERHHQGTGRRRRPAEPPTSFGPPAEQRGSQAPPDAPRRGGLLRRLLASDR